MRIYLFTYLIVTTFFISLCLTDKWVEVFDDNYEKNDASQMDEVMPLNINRETLNTQFVNVPGVRRVARKRKIIYKPKTQTIRKKILKKKVKKPLSIGEPLKNPLVNFTQTNPSSKFERDARFFSLFTVIRFKNDPCPTNNGKNGTCYTRNDCSKKGGVVEGSCAGGFGVCCFFEHQCGATTAENSTYFVNPNPNLRICTLMVKRMNDDICQVRLDLETFELAQPNAQGECTTDSFTVTGATARVPQICGVNTGQHLIYSITPVSGPSQLSIVTQADSSTPTSTTRSWRIRITQLECDSRMLAPVGCLQYYTSASGIIQSFNYREEVDGNNPNHLAELDYAICMRVENGYCGIRYSQTANTYSFTITGDATPATLPASGIKVGDADCNTDYLLITGASSDGQQIGKNVKDRYCGTGLGRCDPSSTTCGSITAGSITTYSQPFIVQVVTDKTEPTASDKANRGFQLNYSQQPCHRSYG